MKVIGIVYFAKWIKL